MGIDPDACTNRDHRREAHTDNKKYNALMEEMKGNGVKNDHAKLGEICVLCAYEIGKAVGYMNAMKEE